jgi:hypothetical protein
MTEIRFSADLYSGFAIDEAVKVYSDLARFELEKEPAEFIVRLTATDDDVDEATLAAELANYALGLTIEKDSRAETT